jgi:hypothetical protein
VLSQEHSANHLDKSDRIFRKLALHELANNDKSGTLEVLIDRVHAGNLGEEVIPILQQGLSVDTLAFTASEPGLDMLKQVMNCVGPQDCPPRYISVEVHIQQMPVLPPISDLLPKYLGAPSKGQEIPGPEEITITQINLPSLPDYLCLNQYSEDGCLPFLDKIAIGGKNAQGIYLVGIRKYRLSRRDSIMLDPTPTEKFNWRFYQIHSLSVVFASSCTIENVVALLGEIGQKAPYLESFEILYTFNAYEGYILHHTDLVSIDDPSLVRVGAGWLKTKQDAFAQGLSALTHLHELTIPCLLFPDEWSNNMRMTCLESFARQLAEAIGPMESIRIAVPERATRGQLSRKEFEMRVGKRSAGSGGKIEVYFTETFQGFNPEGQEED